jgi:hypothetical protein
MTVTRHLYAILGLVTVLSAVSLSAGHAARTPATQNVLVTNTSGNPVQTNVVSLPAVQIASGQTVGISGTPNVNVGTLPAVQFASGAAVAVNNASNNPVPIRDTAVISRTALSLSAYVPFATSEIDQETNLYLVPINKRLVIREVSVQITVPEGQEIGWVEISGDSNERFVRLQVPVTAQGLTFGVQHFVGSLTGCTWSFDEGSLVHMDMYRSSTAGAAAFQYAITGYLEDAP